MEARVGDRPLFVLELGMPPDVEPAVGRLAGVTLVDLTALGRHLAHREVPDQVPQVRSIVAAAAAACSDRQAQAAAAPVIAAMHAQIRQLADSELVRLQDRLPDPYRPATGRDGRHDPPHPWRRPTVRAKEFSAGPNGPVDLGALRQLFDLNSGSQSDAAMMSGGTTDA